MTLATKAGTQGAHNPPVVGCLGMGQLLTQEQDHASRTCVVSMMPAMPHAFVRPLRVTLAGSMMPAAIKSCRAEQGDGSGPAQV